MGPLKGVKIVEMGGIGSEPFSAMMMADMGAEIIRLERYKESPGFMDPKLDFTNRGRRSIYIDLKKPEGIDATLKLIKSADALIEGFRPGVMERLGLGPEDCLKLNSGLVYGRITGWGQEGPMANAAGHDINYIAITGALHAIGRPNSKPVPPLNLVGDFGGGGLLLAFGMACALYEAKISGKGQVVDAAMVDGASVLMTMMHGLRSANLWSNERGSNLVDGGAHFYDTYETSDGKYVAIGSIEPQFYKILVEKLGVDASEYKDQMNVAAWPEMKEKITAVFKTKTRDEWCELMEGTDACFSPVLTMEEAMEHPHNVARNSFVTIDGATQPAPAPRFSRTKEEIQFPAPIPGENTLSVLEDWGFSASDIETLKKDDII